MTSQTVTEQPLHRTWVAGRIVSAAGSDPAAAVMNAEAPRERVEPGTGERAMRSLSAVAPQNRNEESGSEQAKRWAAAYLRARGVTEGRARRREGGGDTAAWSCDLIIASTPSLSLARRALVWGVSALGWDRLTRPCSKERRGTRGGEPRGAFEF